MNYFNDIGSIIKSDFMLIVVIVLALAFTIVDAYAKGYKVLVLKGLATTSVLIYAITNMPVESTFRIESVYIIFALVFALSGDLFLALKKIYSNDSRFFYAGVASFLIGHIFYLVYIIDVVSLIPAYYLLIPLIVSISFGLINYYLSGFVGLNYDGKKKASTIYIMVLSFVTTFAIVGISITNNLTLLATGLVFFLISDVILSFVYFSKFKYNKLLSILNHLFYFTALILIAMSTTM